MPYFERMITFHLDILKYFRRGRSRTNLRIECYWLIVWLIFYKQHFYWDLRGFSLLLISVDTCRKDIYKFLSYKILTVYECRILPEDLGSAWHVFSMILTFRKKNKKHEVSRNTGRWIDQHDTRVIPRQKSNPGPSEHMVGALSTELLELMERSHVFGW